MNIYHLATKIEFEDSFYEEAIVIAANEREARKTHPDSCLGYWNQEGGTAWCDENKKWLHRGEAGGSPDWPENPFDPEQLWVECLGSAKPGSKPRVVMYRWNED